MMEERQRDWRGNRRGGGNNSQECCNIDYKFRELFHKLSHNYIQLNFQLIGQNDISSVSTAPNHR